MRVLRVLTSLLLTLLFAVLAMALLGARLPLEHDAAASITIDAAQGKVWSLIEDVNGQTAWRSDLQRIDTLPDRDGHRCWTEVQKHRSLSFCEEVTAAPVTRVIVLAEPNLNFAGTWTWTLTALTPSSTVVSVNEHGITKPPLRRFLGRYIYHEHATLRRYERELKVFAEAH